MKLSTKHAIAMPMILFCFFAVSFTWYVIVMRPQRKAIIQFLEALRTRNDKLLQEYVAPEEHHIYKRLYLKNGHNKHLLSYEDLAERNANDYFWPTMTRFSVEVEEDDVFFGKRKHTYFISVEKKDKWRVVQFSTQDDYYDLKKLQDINPPSPIPEGLK